MSTEVQTVPKVDTLMEKNNMHVRRRHDRMQNRRNTYSSGSLCGTAGNVNSAGTDTGGGGVGNAENNNKQHKKNKHDSEARHFKSGRKRLQSFNSNGGKFFPPYKRRKKEGVIVPPTKFLLGGNICDPLNLNSLQDEEVNRAMNAVTPKSSPLPTPRHRKGQIEVIIPPNIYDPLNLAACDDDAEYEAMLTSPIKRSQKKQKKNKKRKHSRLMSGPGSGKEDTADETRLSGDEKKFSEGEENVSAQETFESAVNIVSSKTSIERRNDKEDEPPTKRSVRSEFADTAPVTVPASADDKQVNVDTVDASAPTGSKTEDAAIPVEPTVLDNKNSLKSELNLDLDTSVTYKLPHPSPNVTSKDGKKENLDSSAGSSTSNTSNTFKKIRKELKDKIVSPVIPQPGAWGDPRNHWYRSQPQRLTPQINKGQATPKFKENNLRFQYGNYNRYYGYRNANEDCDVRLKVLARSKDLFECRDVLDVGCNVGHVTLALARDFRPKKIVGIDIDRTLIEAAKRNIRHYLNPRDKHYPASMPLLYGPVNVPSTSQPENCFPHNISFIQGNYVLESDVLISMEQPQFDTILCLSVTKWLHLNWGDEGLKRAFKRMYAQLRPGGVLILEPQPWHSYKKKRNLTPQIWRNYQNIGLFPHKFSQFLLSEVGFTKCEVIGAPLHLSRGFQRPIKLFTKGCGDVQSIPPIPSSTVVTEDNNPSDLNIANSEKNDGVNLNESEIISTDKIEKNTVVTRDNQSTSGIVLNEIGEEAINCDIKMCVDNNSDGKSEGDTKNFGDQLDVACDTSVCPQDLLVTNNGGDKTAISSSEMNETPNDNNPIVNSTVGNSVKSYIDCKTITNPEK